MEIISYYLISFVFKNEVKFKQERFNFNPLRRKNFRIYVKLFEASRSLGRNRRCPSRQGLDGEAWVARSLHGRAGQAQGGALARTLAGACGGVYAKRPAPSRVVAETIKSLPPEQFGIADFFARVASLSLGVLAFVVGSLVVQGVIAPQLAKIEIQPAAVALAESGLSIGEGLALATYEAISGLFDSTISALATLFAPKPQIIVVAPTPEQNRENKISNT